MSDEEGPLGELISPAISHVIREAAPLNSLAQLEGSVRPPPRGLGCNLLLRIENVGGNDARAELDVGVEAAAREEAGIDVALRWAMEIRSDQLHHGSAQTRERGTSSRKDS
jgi:hypothetical protein